MAASLRSSWTCTRNVSNLWTSTRTAPWAKMTCVLLLTTLVNSWTNLTWILCWAKLEDLALLMPWSKCSKRRWLVVSNHFWYKKYLGTYEIENIIVYIFGFSIKKLFIYNHILIYNIIGIQSPHVSKKIANAIILRLNLAKKLVCIFWINAKIWQLSFRLLLSFFPFDEIETAYILMIMIIVISSRASET